MAFQDITKVLYEGKIKLDYKDKTHRYYVRERINFDLPEENPKAWGKVVYPTGTTSLLQSTLEKEGLMRYAMTKCLMNLFGFYDFTGDDGERRTGYSEGLGTLWSENDTLLALSREQALEVILWGSHASDRHKGKGASIGTVVHDAIEHYIKGLDFDIAEQYMWNIKEAFPPPAPGEVDLFVADRNECLKDFDVDVEMAKKAFLIFENWWLKNKPTLYGAEDLLYSVQHNVCGTYDGDLGIALEQHPVFSLPTEQVPVAFAEVYARVHENGSVRCTTDWKTSNASKSKSAAMPEGINYQYFIQDAIYEIQRREMGLPPADDLLVVSARKDGGFTLIYASELGLTVEDCIEWALSVIHCHKMKKKTQEALLAHAEPKEVSDVSAI